MSPVDYMSIVVATIFILLPSLALLRWLIQDQRLSLGERVGLAASITIVTYPLLHLWAYQFGMQVGSQLVWLLSIVGIIVLLWQSISGRQTLFSKPHLTLSSRQCLFILAVVLLILSRFYAIGEMVAPAWADSVHHTILAQLFVDHNGLFKSWLPYTKVDTFTYHFGFHLAAANSVWLTGLSMPQAVLGMGQMLNVLAVLALYPLAVRLSGGNQWAGLGAVVIGGFISQHPAFYVNWGRYTQLTGQIILPGLIWLFDRWWNEEESPRWGHGVLITILAAGMALTHYRVAFLSLAAGLAWMLCGLWRWRHNRVELRIRLFKLAFLAGIAILLIAPWLRIVAQGKLPTVYGAMIQQTVQQPNTYSEIGIWRSLDHFYPIWLWGSALIALFLGIWQMARHFVPLALWCVIAFIFTNPFLFQLPGTGWISNLLVVIALYIPISLAIGWLIGQFKNWLQPNYRWSLAALLIILMLWGGYQQATVVDPFFQMVMPEDLSAFAWINENISEDAYFAINGFLAFADRSVVGSDAGWWLPYYTLHQNTIPPLISVMESTPNWSAYNNFRQLHIDIQRTGGETAQLRDIFCHYAMTHIYLGQKRGSVGFGAVPSIREEWLIKSESFRLLHQVDQAQIWQFKNQSCP